MANKREVEVWRGQVRIPVPLMNWVEERAKNSYRTVNAEFVEVVRELKQLKEERNAAQ